MGSLGRQIAPPKVLSGGSADIDLKLIPPPEIAYTADEVEAMFSTRKDAYFRIIPDGFWDGKNYHDLKNGCRVLWNNGKTAKNGEESTKVEFFGGTISGWLDEEFVVIS